MPCAPGAGARLPGAWRCTLVFALQLSLGLAHAGTDQSESIAPRSTTSGVYTAAQATRGEDTYMNACVACHPPGTYAAPSFRLTWNGRPLSELFDYVSEKMPKNDPGGLSAPEYAQLVAYLLKVNSAPAGKTELPADSAALSKIRLEIPSTSPGKTADR